MHAYVCLSVCLSVCVQDDGRPDTSNPASNSSGMGSGAASSSAGSPASKPNTTSNTGADCQESSSSPASIHVAVCISLQLFTDYMPVWLRCGLDIFISLTMTACKTTVNML